MRDNVDVWPQALWGPRTAHEYRAERHRSGRGAATHWLSGPPSSLVTNILVFAGLLAAVIGTVLLLALVVAPSAGAAGGCGGG